MKKNNYINGTKICQDISKEVGKCKQIYDWFKINKTKEFIKYVANIYYNKISEQEIPCSENSIKEKDKFTEARIPAFVKVEQGISISTFQPYIIVKGIGRKFQYLQGTYIHLDLVTNLCEWASDKFAYKISCIVQFISGFNSKLKELEKEEIEDCNKITEKLKEVSDKKLKKDKELVKIKNQLTDCNKEIKKLNQELENKDKELTELKKKTDIKTKIIKNKNKLVEELKEEIKTKTEELEKLKENFEVNDIEIKKLSRKIELLKEKLKNALDDNIGLNDLIKQQNNNILNLTNIIMKNQEEIKEFRDKLESRDNQILEMLNKQDIMLNKLSKLEKDKEKN